MKRCVIVGGAKISDYIFVKSHLKSDDFVIYCDCGLNHMQGLNVKPDLIIGDFDSHANPCLSTETIVLPHEKDDTDTVFAVKEALRRGFSDFLLVGVVGERLDHTLGNLSILLMLDELNKSAVIVDDYSEISALSDTAEIEDSCLYFSLLNISGKAEGVDIEDAKYPLKNATVTCTYPIGVSNEVLKGKTAKIKVRNGCLLLIKITNSVC